MPIISSVTSNLADIKKELHELPDKVANRYAKRAMLDVAAMVLAEVQRRANALPFPYSKHQTRSELEIVKGKPRKSKDSMYLIKAPWYIRLYEAGFVHKKSGKFIKKGPWFATIPWEMQEQMEERFTATVNRLTTKYWKKQGK